MTSQHERRNFNLPQGMADLNRSHSRLTNSRVPSSPMLHALNTWGASHIYVECADHREIANLLKSSGGDLYSELDGNYVNQALVGKVLSSHLADGELRQRWRRLGSGDGLQSINGGLPIMLYTTLAGRIADEIMRTIGDRRLWEISLQLHMSVVDHADLAGQFARRIHAAMPVVIVTIPFAPQSPECLLVARDLEKEGIRVNLTSTFSARQALTAAIIGNVSKTSILVEPLNRELHAKMLGEHATLVAQRALLWQRRNGCTKTQLTVAGIREWQTLERTAGCDAFMAPCHVLKDFMERPQVNPSQIISQLATSYADQIQIDPGIQQNLIGRRFGCMYRIEAEFVEFLHELNQSISSEDIKTGDELYRRFERAGFGDVFYSPDLNEWRTIHDNRLSDIGEPLIRRCAVDTLCTLCINDLFQKQQVELDAEILDRI